MQSPSAFQVHDDKATLTSRPSSAFEPFFTLRPSLTPQVAPKSSPSRAVPAGSPVLARRDNHLAPRASPVSKLKLGVASSPRFAGQARSLISALKEPRDGLHSIRIDDVPYVIYLDPEASDQVDRALLQRGLPALERLP